MSVAITIRWHFIRDGEDVTIAYGDTSPRHLEAEAHEVNERPYLSETKVLPLQSSVLAPGLSMPVPAG